MATSQLDTHPFHFRPFLALQPPLALQPLLCQIHLFGQMTSPAQHVTALKGASRASTTGYPARTQSQVSPEPTPVTARQS